MAKQQKDTTITLKPLTFKEAPRELANTRKHQNIGKRIEDYKPGATQAQVHKALKRVAKSPKPSEKHA